MKKALKNTFLALAFLSFLACEKDDICTQDDPTTAGVVIEFFDINNPNTAKTPTGLIAQANGSQLGISAQGNKLTLPLLVNNTHTTWQLILNADDTDPNNDIVDQIDFDYVVNHQFVSKACGYKAIFSLNETSPVMNTTNWIQNLNLLNTNITSQNETHIKIYF